MRQIRCNMRHSALSERNVVKSIFFKFCFFIISTTNVATLFSQDVYYVNRTEMLYREYAPHVGVISELYEGEIIDINSPFVGTDSKGVSRVVVKTENGISGWLATDAISVKDSVALPEEITEKRWTHSYYLDVLRSGKKETLFVYEPFWRDHFYEYKNKYGHDFYNTWTELAYTNYMTITNIFNTFYDLTNNYWYLINGKIEEKNDVYQFFAICIYKFGYFTESELNKYFNVNEKVKIALCLDGDYLEVFVNDTHLFTLIVLDEEIEFQFQCLMENNACDLTHITWPRRADGSMDYPPPEVPDNTQAEQSITEPVEIASAVESQENAVTKSTTRAGKESMPIWAWIMIICGGAVAVGGVALFIEKRMH